MIKGIVMIIIGAWFGLYLLPLALDGIRAGDLGSTGLGVLFLLAFVGMPIFFGGFFIRRHVLRKRANRITATKG